MPNTTYCKEWVTTEEALPLPSQPFLTAYMSVLALAALVFGITIRSLRPQAVRRLLADAGVAMHKVKKTATEIERKIFHLCGLLVPLAYQLLLTHGVSRSFCVQLCWLITVLGVSADWLRVHVPFVRDNWPLKSILREKEADRLCGGSYFSLGCTLAIQMFAPVIAMTSILFLVMGDMAAALIGRSFGQSICSIGIGPGGKKSVEGSTAMFMTCFVFGCTLFSPVHLREYAVAIGSLVATLTELYEPLGINDNVTIPLLSGVALTFGFARTYSCEPARSPLLWYL
ncbi:DGK1 [Symbiodinium microadriaticum]|nr:DGK1 [Symbiodinium microadriaticum]CAE7924204.1 DGK1 [Symbiodinium sp. KB8]|mmetsp:Transcript_133962/g.317670  ORF Transcript_133962/g.317670 Transcript_133962/m.317670 type:complete len:285 (-) Transcript_133962:93-947(-)